MTEMLRRLMDHMRWADARILDALTAANEPPRDPLEIYSHVLGAEAVWLARLTGAQAPPVWPDLTLEECANLAQRNADGFIAFVDSLSADSLQRLVTYRNSAGAEFESRIDDIVMHVALHGQYHRGQVNQLLRRGGAEPRPVDYIAYVRGAPAATRG